MFRKDSEICSNSIEFFPYCALAGRLDIFKEAELRGLQWRLRENFGSAVLGGRVKLLKWLLEKEDPKQQKEIVTFLLELTAELGKLKILKYFREFPDFWTDRISQYAARGGHVNILEYVWENGLPIDLLKVCEGAAKGTKLENPWNEGNLRVLKWARKKKGKWDFFSKELVTCACERPDHKILRWLLVHGYILPEHEEILKLRFGPASAGKMEKEEFLKIKDALR